MEKRKFLTLPGLENSEAVGRSACSQSLYRLSYRGSSVPISVSVCPIVLALITNSVRKLQVVSTVRWVRYLRVFVGVKGRVAQHRVLLELASEIGVLVCGPGVLDRLQPLLLRELGGFSGNCELWK
jgi:hypothetical protein